MSLFGDVPTQHVADALERHVAKINDADLTALVLDALDTMPIDARSALVQSLFSAFRDRGESSEDAVEGAATTLLAIESGDLSGQRQLLMYAGQNTGLLKEALSVLAHDHPTALAALPSTLIDGISARL